MSDHRARRIQDILAQFADGACNEKEAEASIRACFESDLGFARLDTDRAARRGFPEVIYGAGKSKEQLLQLVTRSMEQVPNVLCTRVMPEDGADLKAELSDFEYDAVSKVGWIRRDTKRTGVGTIAVVSAGTTDEYAAREALICAEVMGNQVVAYRDVGVAGLHRLLGVIDAIREAHVIISVAGMEAALPSVLAGLVARPIVSVPTSVGYGANFEGLAALLASLTACAPGVVTVNIDNGFGAAYAASLINHVPEPR